MRFPSERVSNLPITELVVAENPGFKCATHLPDGEVIIGRDVNSVLERLFKEDQTTINYNLVPEINPQTEVVTIFIFPLVESA